MLLTQGRHQGYALSLSWHECMRYRRIMDSDIMEPNFISKAISSKRETKPQATPFKIKTTSPLSIDGWLPDPPNAANQGHYDDVRMGAMASQITSLTVVYSTVYSGADQSKHQSSASLAFVWGIHRWPVNSPHKWPVTRKMFPFDDVIMQ